MALLVAVFGDSDRAIDAALVQLRTIRSVVDDPDIQFDHTYIDLPTYPSVKGTYYFRDVADPNSVCKVVVENEYLWQINSDGVYSWSHSDDYFSLFNWDECISLTEFKSDWERLRSDFDYVFASGLHGNLRLEIFDSDEEPEVREFEPIKDHDGPVLATFRDPLLSKGSYVNDEFDIKKEATINFSDDAIQSHAAIRVQTYTGSVDLLLGLIKKHLRQRNRSTFLKWYSQPFASMFPELDEITAEYQDLNFDRLDTILTKKKEQRATEDLKTFGLTIPSGLLGYLGISVLLGMQVYFAVHLMAARPRLRRATVPWIGLYDTKLSRCIVGFSAVALPVIVSWIVCLRTSAAVAGFGQIVLIVSTVGVLFVAGEIAVLLRPQKWGGDIADVPEDVKSANECAKHLRFVHFSLVVVSVTLIASALIDRSSTIVKAIAQLETVRIAIDNLDDSKFFEDHARKVWEVNAAEVNSEWLFKEGETSGNASIYQVIPWGVEKFDFVPRMRDMSKLADFKLFWDNLLQTRKESVLGRAGPKLFFALSDILDENYEDNPMEEGVENFVIMDRVEEPSDDQISGAIELYLEGYTNQVDLNDFGIDPGVEFEFLLGGDYESWGVPILPVDYVDLEFGWLDVYVEEVLAIDPDVFGDWRVAPFAKTFSELDQAAVHYQDLDIEWLVRILRRESDRTSGSRFEALGVSASIRLLGWIGLPVMLGIQLYFLLHLLSAKGSLCRADFPWIGLYKTKSARLVLAVSAVLLPSAVAVVLSIHVARSGTTVQSLISFAIATAVVTVASLTWSRLGFPTLFRSNA